ncbi:MAG: cohesin domain-containing protein [Bacteroidales bacterium]
MKTKAVLFWILIFFSSQTIKAQNAPVTSIGNFIMNSSTITVPVTVCGFTNIGSCNLKIMYNPLIVRALNLSIASGVGGNVSVNLNVSGEITLGWYAYPGKTLADNSIIFNIVFQKINEGTTSLSFFDNGYSCIYYNGSWTALNDLPSTTYYQNGSITVLPVNSPKTYLSTISADSGTIVSVPVKVNSFKCIGQFSLTLVYNPNVLSYINIENNSSFPALSISQSVAGTLVINGLSSAFSGISFQDSTILFTLNFTYNGGTTTLSWMDNGNSCKYSGPQGSPVYNDSPQENYYINGSVIASILISGNLSVCPNTQYAYQIPLLPNATCQWSITGGIITSGANTNFVSVLWNDSMTSGTISVTVNYSNISVTVSKTITINQEPLPDIIGATNVSCNNYETYYTLGSSNQFFWTVVGGIILNGQGSNTIQVDWDSCSSCISRSVSVTETTVLPAGCSATSTLNVSISVPVRSIYGQLTYDNSLNTPLNGVLIQLIDSSNLVVAYTTTSTHIIQSIPGNQVQIDGYYEFYNINNGNYFLKATTTIPWKGVTATDALMVKLHSAGIVTLTGLPVKAADVNLSNCINSTDALIIELRCVGIKNDFDTEDWIFANTIVNVNGPTEHNFYALVTGDVNKSYIPLNEKKDINNTYFQKDGVLKINNYEDFELPFKVNDYISLGAFTLNLNYNDSLFDVTAINSKLNELEFNISNGSIMIAWSDVNPVHFKPDDILFALKMKTKVKINSNVDLFNNGIYLDFADRNGNSLQGIQLKISNIYVQDDSFYLNINPNPFKTDTEIFYSLPESGNVILYLYNSIGQRINILTDEYKSEGNYNIDLNVLGLQTGIYFCEMIFNGATSKYQKIIKLLKTN